MNQNQNGRQKTGFNRPFSPNVGQQISGITEELKKGIVRPESACPHKKQTAAVGGGGVKFESALSPMMDQNGKVKGFTNYLEYNGQRIGIKFNLFTCSECGKTVTVLDTSEMPNGYAGYHKMVADISLILKNLASSMLYLDTTFEGGEGTGVQLISMLLDPNFEFARFGKAQFLEYIAQQHEKSKRIAEKVENKVDGTGDIDPSIIIGGSTIQPKVNDIYSGFKGDNFVQQGIATKFETPLGQQQQTTRPMQQVQTGVANPNSGGLKRKK